VSVVVIQRQLSHRNFGITSVYIQGIANAEIIETGHARRTDDPGKHIASTRIDRGPLIAESNTAVEARAYDANVSGRPTPGFGRRAIYGGCGVVPRVELPPGVKRERPSRAPTQRHATAPSEGGHLAALRLPRYA
jgi:hypothetical protein